MRTVSVTTTGAAKFSEEIEGAPPATSHNLVEDTFVVLLDESHHLQALRDFQKGRDVAWVELSLLVQCITRHDSCPMVEVETLKLSHFANKMTSVIRSNSL